MRIDPAWLSPERFEEYLEAASGDPDIASRLYEWNAEVSAALFELIHHFEVLLRNAIVEKLKANGQSPLVAPGTPWMQGHKQIEEVQGRLRRRSKEVTAGRVYAGLTFGFWQNMFSTEYEELWRHALQYVFIGARADRSVIAAYLESVNQLRNRIAHHGSMVELDTGVEAEKIVRLSAWINKDAATWLRSIERVTTVTARRPIKPPRNVVVVPGTDAWNLYSTYNQPAYIFPVGRAIKVVDHLAFYADQEIKPVVASILAKFDAVDFSRRNMARLDKSSEDLERDLGKIIGAVLGNKNLHGWNAGMYQVLMLSPMKDDRTAHLPSPITHGKRGRGSAFARSHRYHALGELLSAKDTSELPERRRR